MISADTAPILVQKEPSELNIPGICDMILNWGLSGEGVLYGGEPMDITHEVLDRLNANHPMTELETLTD